MKWKYISEISLIAPYKFEEKKKFQLVTLNPKKLGTQVSPWFCLSVSSLSLSASFLRPLPSSSAVAHLLSTPSNLPPTSALCSSSASRLSLLFPTFCLSKLFPASVNTHLIGFLPSSWLTNGSKQGLIYSSSFGVVLFKGLWDYQGESFHSIIAECRSQFMRETPGM